MSVLLERDDALTTLRAALEELRGGRSGFVVVSGPAGIGKSALLQVFLEEGNFEAYAGSCDPLSIPHPLQPFEDIARKDEALDLALQDGSQSFRKQLLSKLQARRYAVVAIEDIHWADQASLELIQYLARRLNEIPVLLVVTIRSGLPLDHPALGMLGQLPAGETSRLELEELSKTAVAELARNTDRAPEQVYELTGGNPFLVTEFLASDLDVPFTVRSSVAARIRSLDDPALETATTLAVIPGVTSWDLVECLGISSRALADLEVEGLVVSSEDGVSYRHELHAHAVAESLTPSEKRALSQRVLDCVSESAPSARIAHHALEAGATDLLVEHSLIAMRHASLAGAHSEALSHGLNVLTHLDTLPVEARADFYQRLSQEYRFNQMLPEALEALTTAIGLWRETDQVVSLGSALNEAASDLWSYADPERSDEYRQEAISVLESVEPSRELVDAYVSRAFDYVLSSQIDDALNSVETAIQLAESLEDDLGLADALGAREVMLVAKGRPVEARRDGDLAIEIKRSHNAQRKLSIQYSNRIAAAINTMSLEHVDADIGAARVYADEIDSTSHNVRLDMHTARLYLLRGQWDLAGEMVEAILSEVETGLTRSTPLVVRSRLEARRGNASEASEALSEAIALVSETRDIQRIGGAAAAAAEHSWLGHEVDLDFVRNAFTLASTSGYLGFYSNLAIWLRRLGEDVAHEGPAPEAHLRELAGDGVGAAAVWESLRFPYERALSLAFSGDADSMRTSIDILEDLGASASRDRVYQMLRDSGQRLGRRQTAATRSNPAGLTRRQLEVLDLLSRDMTNAEIAEALFISPKTVEHHVSAILTKLGVSTRQDAAAQAAELLSE